MRSSRTDSGKIVDDQLFQAQLIVENRLVFKYYGLILWPGEFVSKKAISLVIRLSAA